MAIPWASSPSMTNWSPVLISNTFLAFADYLKPALRLGALMEVPELYILTHDSLGVGEDGPTHQPIEQLSMLRAMPNAAIAPQKAVIAEVY